MTQRATERAELLFLCRVYYFLRASKHLFHSHGRRRGYGATGARLNPDHKAGSSNLSALILTIVFDANATYCSGIRMERCSAHRCVTMRPNMLQSSKSAPAMHVASRTALRDIDDVDFFLYWFYYLLRGF